MPEFFDSHCHLDFAAFDEDRDQVLRRAFDAGVKRMFVPGVSKAQWPALQQLTAPQGMELHFGVGLHPYFLGPNDTLQAQAALRRLPEWARQLGAVAVGECGLDKLKARAGGAPMAWQLEVFEAHLQCAQNLDLPLVIHVVRAHGDALALLQRYQPARGGVLHSYSGSLELIAKYVALGFYFGFGAAAIQPKARRLREALQAVPEERLVLETDAPDQAPPPGGRNEPAKLASIAGAIAELRGIGVPKLAQVTTANARRLFGLD